MKAQHLGKVWLLDHIDDAADGIENPTKKKQEESALRNTRIHITNEKDDHPSHHEIEESVEHSGNPWYKNL